MRYLSFRLHDEVRRLRKTFHCYTLFLRFFPRQVFMSASASICVIVFLALALGARLLVELKGLDILAVCYSIVKDI